MQLPFDIQFYGQTYSSLWVNNNGNVTFDDPLSTYVPFDLSQTGHVIIAPFFADVDTRGSNAGTVTYGETQYQGRRAFCVLWDKVGYFDTQSDKLNTFQLQLVERPDGFDIVFTYDQIQWDLGSASSGVSARAGFSNGSDKFAQIAGSAVNDAFLDGGPQSLVTRSLGSPTPGEFVFQVRNGCTKNDPRNVPSGFTCDSDWWTWPDTDKDGLPDNWERDGVYVRGERLDLAAQGARVGVVDAFVYVQKVAGERWNSTIESMIAGSFADSPINGGRGIAMHFIHPSGDLTRDQVPARVEATRDFFNGVTRDVPAGGGPAFNSTPWAQSPSTPQLAKYVLVGPDHAGGTGIGGEAIGIVGDHLLVTMNENRWLDDIFREVGDSISWMVRIDMLSPSFRDHVYDTLNAITTMHELGHLYGLRHHGDENLPNSDAHYKSIMSYAYNAFGVPRGEGLARNWYLDYSRESTPVNLDWRLAENANALYGAITLIHGQHGERGDFYSTVDEFPEPQAPLEGGEPTIEELLANPDVVANGLGFLKSLDHQGPAIVWNTSITDGASYAVGAVPAAPTCSATDEGVGVAADCVVTGYSTDPGEHVLVVSVADQLGNQTSEARRYNVHEPTPSVTSTPTPSGVPTPSSSPTRTPSAGGTADGTRPAADKPSADGGPLAHTGGPAGLALFGVGLGLILGGAVLLIRRRRS